MKAGSGLLAGAVLIVSGAVAMATPSTEMWSPASSDIQPFGVVHLGMDNYFTVDKTAASGSQGNFPTDLGLTVGVLPFEKIQMEVGVDALYAADNPYYFNAKIGSPENAWCPYSPAVNVGIFNVGTKKGVTDYNIVDFIAGMTLPLDLGRVHAGVYKGNSSVLVSGEGEDKSGGWMVGYDRTLIKDKLTFAADYISGKNLIGGGGCGLNYFFSKDVSILVGPVWFNDQTLNGAMKWSAQLDANF